MTSIQRLLDELQRAYDGDPWHGLPLMTLLANITPEQAADRTIPGAHTIAELVTHLAVWQDVARRRITGTVPTLTPEQDWPPVGSWPAALDALSQSHLALLAAVEALVDADLDRPVELEGEGSHPLGVMLHGVAQHAAYHGGQIALLKRTQG